MMDVAVPNPVSSIEAADSPPRVAIAACMLAGMCTFLNVYDTQPLLPYLRQIFNASEIAVSLTVSSTILAMALTAPFIGLTGRIRRPQESHRTVALRADRANVAGGHFAKSASTHLLAIHAGHLRSRRDRGHHGLHQ